MNEPWWNTDLTVLKDFYRQVRKMVQRLAPQAYFVFHNSFRYDVNQWNDLFRDDDIDKVVMDHHYYQAFNNPSPFNTVKDSCDDYEQNAAYAEQFKYQVWFGEWALATDVCALWLGGFNDGNTPQQQECQMVDCPVTYLPSEFTNATVDPSIDINGPFGYGIDGDATNYTIRAGKCTKDSAYFSDDDVKQIAKCALESYNKHLDGHFMWTAHNELEERWDYIKAYDMGWLNQTVSVSSEKSQMEPSSEFI